MAKTFDKDDDKLALQEDHEIELAVAELEGIDLESDGQNEAEPLMAVVPDNEIPFDELSSEELNEQLKRSAKMVVETCMDIRRGENVLIVCDPTTGDIGQALHEAANERSDRVLLIVMPKARHHGEEPQARWRI